jgi:hypothetical protein
MAQVTISDPLELNVANVTCVGSLGESASVRSDVTDPNRNNNYAFGERVDFYDCSRGCLIEQIFCNQGFSSSMATNRPPTTLQSLSHLAQSGFVPDLLMYYDIRDKVILTRPNGLHYDGLYDTHNNEMLTLILADPELFADALATLELWEPNLRAMVENRAETTVVTADQVDALDTFLNELVAVGSPELKQAINQERANLPNLTSFIGQSMTEVGETVLGPVTVYLPVLVRPE